ncbi:Xaa-Pro dipeptidase [Frateuria aurantia]
MTAQRTPYQDHLDILRQRADQALARAGFDHLIVAAGRPLRKFADDQDYPFAVNPAFKHWLPLVDAPGSWLIYSPGQRPRLIFLQPQDYWHVVPAAPTGDWVEHFDISIIRQPLEAEAELKALVARAAILGAATDALPAVTPNNPTAVVAYLDYHRAVKTEYELDLMRQASQLGARAHRAAEQAFRAGASELDIHLAYMAAAGQTEAELPYGNIVCLNEHGAILHYTRLQRTAPAQSRSLLIDAGASAAGYASDITRSHAHPGASEFQAFIDAVDAAERGFAAQVVAGQSYPDLHLHAHHVLAGVLREHGIIRMSPEAAVQEGVSSVFFPHGLGHLIGLQVHDVAGFAPSDHGGHQPPPDGHPYLRLTRQLEPGMVVTIEPGLYFIDMLLAELRTRPASIHIDWARVDAFRPYGGVRIEDNVVCTRGAPENLTRQAFALLAD